MSPPKECILYILTERTTPTPPPPPVVLNWDAFLWICLLNTALPVCLYNCYSNRAGGERRLNLKLRGGGGGVLSLFVDCKDIYSWSPPDTRTGPHPRSSHPAPWAQTPASRSPGPGSACWACWSCCSATSAAESGPATAARTPAERKKYL